MHQKHKNNNKITEILFKLHCMKVNHITLKPYAIELLLSTKDNKNGIFLPKLKPSRILSTLQLIV